MFTAGRILRNINQRDSVFQPSSVLVSRPKKKRKKFRCYVPFVWQALTAACIGLVVVLVGVGLCIVGYHADRLMSIMHDDTPLQPRHLNNYNDYDNNSEVNGTETAWAHLAGTYIHLKYLIYLGPALMSCGSFAIVFSCVVVCETRDKALQLIEQREQAGIHGAKAFRGVKLDFFNSVVNPRRKLRNRDAINQAYETSSAAEDKRESAAGAKGIVARDKLLSEAEPGQGPVGVAGQHGTDQLTDKEGDHCEDRKADPLTDRPSALFNPPTEDAAALTAEVGRSVDGSRGYLGCSNVRYLSCNCISALDLCTGRSLQPEGSASATSASSGTAAAAAAAAAAGSNSYPQCRRSSEQRRRPGCTVAIADETRPIIISTTADKRRKTKTIPESYATTAAAAETDATFPASSVDSHQLLPESLPCRRGSMGHNPAFPATAPYCQNVYAMVTNDTPGEVGRLSTLPYDGVRSPVGNMFQSSILHRASVHAEEGSPILRGDHRNATTVVDVSRRDRTLANFPGESSSSSGDAGDRFETENEHFGRKGGTVLMSEKDPDKPAEACSLYDDDKYGEKSSERSGSIFGRRFRKNWSYSYIRGRSSCNRGRSCNHARTNTPGFSGCKPGFSSCNSIMRMTWRQKLKSLSAVADVDVLSHLQQVPTLKYFIEKEISKGCRKRRQWGPSRWLSRYRRCVSNNRTASSLSSAAVTDPDVDNYLWIQPQ